VVEATSLAAGVRSVTALNEVDVAAQEAGLAAIREVMADRQRYIEIS
jgi:hypothetical protein